MKKYCTIDLSLGRKITDYDIEVVWKDVIITKDQGLYGVIKLDSKNLIPNVLFEPKNLLFPFEFLDDDYYTQHKSKQDFYVVNGKSLYNNYGNCMLESNGFQELSKMSNRVVSVFDYFNPNFLGSQKVKDYFLIADKRKQDTSVENENNKEALLNNKKLVTIDCWDIEEVKEKDDLILIKSNYPFPFKSDKKIYQLYNTYGNLLLSQVEADSVFIINEQLLIVDGILINIDDIKPIYHLDFNYKGETKKLCFSNEEDWNAVSALIKSNKRLDNIKLKRRIKVYDKKEAQKVLKKKQNILHK